MEPLKFFVICLDEETMHKSVAFINEKGMFADGTTDPATAKDKFILQKYDIVIFSGGIDNKMREKLKRELTGANKEIEIVEHYGNPQNLLPELMESFEDL